MPDFQLRPARKCSARSLVGLGSLLLGFPLLGCLLFGSVLLGCLDLSLPERGDAAVHGGTGGDGAGGGNTGGASSDAPYCDTDEDCSSNHCFNNVCCAEGGICCSKDAHCAAEGGSLACNLISYQCYEQCRDRESDQDIDERCIDGYHCDFGECLEDIVQGDCSEPSDCASGECIGGHCCEHAGLCCASDEDCPDMFDACATDDSQTCIFSAVTIPGTGQRQCYNAANEPVDCDAIRPGLNFYGQDGHYARAQGSQRSYADPGDNTVRDNVTGLLWTKTASDEMNHRAADSYCNELELAGHSWRLPKRHELQSLVDYGATTTIGIDPLFQVPSGAGQFWTGTALAGGSETSTVWTVDFTAGTVTRTGKDISDLRVLCVAEPD